MINFEKDPYVNDLDLTVQAAIHNYKTKFYQKLVDQSSISPFNPGDSIHTAKQISFSGSLRVVRMYSNGRNLQEEMEKIRIIFLFNTYLPEYIGNHILDNLLRA